MPHPPSNPTHKKEKVREGEKVYILASNSRSALQHTIASIPKTPPFVPPIPHTPELNQPVIKHHTINACFKKSTC